MSSRGIESHDIRWRSLVGTTILQCVIALVLFLVSEFIVRYLAPQLETRVVWNGVHATTNDKDLRYLLTPQYHAVTYNPEFAPYYRVEYRTNSQGLRDERTYGNLKSQNKLRILVLGDSFTYGVANNYADIWPVLFERKLTAMGHPTEVIKAGVWGYDTRDEIMLLKRLYPQYKPDIVVLAFLVNDLFTNGSFAFGGSVQPKVNADAASPNPQTINNLHLLTLAKKLLLKSDYLYTKIYLGTWRASFFNTQSAVFKRQISITKDLLSESRSYAVQNSFKFIVLSIPQAFQVLNTDRKIDVSFIDKDLESFANEAEFPWISTLPDFVKSYAREREDLHYRLDGHLNPKGNRLVADILAARFPQIIEPGEKLATINEFK